MENKEKAKKITDCIYEAFGTNSGWLFGIHPESHGAVVTIVEQTLKVLDFQKKKEDVEETIHKLKAGDKCPICGGKIVASGFHGDLHCWGKCYSFLDSEKYRTLLRQKFVTR